MRKKYIALAMMTAVTFSMLTGGCNKKEKEAQNGKVDYNLALFDNQYEGSYEGKILNKQPEGEGTFSINDSKISKIEGNWKAGQPEGKVTITYKDGSTEQGQMKDGSFSGEVRKTEKDQSYSVSSYVNGTPRGIIRYYDKNDKLTDIDWYYKQVPIQTLCSQAKEYEYSQLLYFPADYTGKPVKITGTVISVYDTEKASYLTVADKEGKAYICKYYNSKNLKLSQGIVPNVVVGEKIEAYGYFYKAAEYEHYKGETSSYDIYSGTLPYVLMFYAQTDSKEIFDKIHPVYTYDNIMKNPFCYAGLNAKITGKVKYVQIDNEKNVTTIKVHAKDGIYYAYSKFDKNDKFLPSVNDIVTITGYYNGLYKEAFEDGKIEADDMENSKNSIKKDSDDSSKGDDSDNESNTQKNNEDDTDDDITYQKYPLISVRSFKK